MKNGKGPKTDPCAMPQVMLCKPDDTLFNEMKCFLLVREEINHSFAIPHILHFSSFFIKI